MARRKRTRGTGDAILLPPPERGQHGPVDRLPRPISDEGGHIACPYFAPNILEQMEDRGAITTGMRQAGEQFRVAFRLAHLDGLRAVDMTKIRVDTVRMIDAPPFRVELTRQRVHEAIDALGGIGSPAGSVVWSVLGLEMSLAKWVVEVASQGRRVMRNDATGVLIAALGMLKAIQNGERHRTVAPAAQISQAETVA